MGEHPFLCEFRFSASANWTIGRLRRNRLGRELELVLSGLLEFKIRRIGYLARHYWVLLNDEDLPNWRSGYQQEMYTWPGAAAFEADELAPVEKLPSLIRIDPAEYYTRTGIGSDRRLEIPANLEELLNSFFALSRSDRDRFLRSCFWFQHARTVYLDSRSAAFASVISAIEALIPPAREAWKSVQHAIGR